MKSRVILAAGFWAASLTLVAQTSSVTVGKYQAHPTRIIARYLDSASAALGPVAVDATGLKTARASTLVPGLVVLDEAPAGIGKAALVGPPAPGGQNLLDRIAALQDTGLFAFVEPDYIVRASLEPNDAAFQDGRLWGLKNTGQSNGKAGADIDVIRAWDLTTGSTNVIVAVIDTGIRYTHQELVSQMWVNTQEVPGNGIDDDGNGFVDDVHGINAILNSGDPYDDNSHGTHCSGTIGAAANDGYPHVGVSWNLRLMGCKFLDSNGSGATSDAITCIDYAVANGARILNNSWGGGGFSQGLRDSIAAAGTKGALFIAAAGNNGMNIDTTPSYPAAYDLGNIVSVAALDRSDNLASFSNYGVRSVDLGAPGVSIFSSVATADDTYAFFNGTSMACPHVVGVAALVLAYHPNASMQELRERLISTTIPVAALAGKSVSGGRVSAYQALVATNDGILEVSVNPPAGSSFCEGSSIPVYVQVSDLSRVTNAVVTATIQGVVGTIPFKNDGRNPDIVADDATYSARVTLPVGKTNIAITFNVTAPTKTNATLVVNYAVEPPPANDAFAGAIKIPSGGGLLFAETTCATTETGEPLHANVPTRSKSVWWNWSPRTSGSVIVDTAGSSFDTVLAVYTGAALNNLIEVASADDVTGSFGTRFQGYVKFNAESGVTYRIAVAGYDVSQSGDVRLRVEPGGDVDSNPPETSVSSPPSGQIVSTNKFPISGTAYDPQPNASGVEEVLIADETDSIFRSVLGTTNWTSIVSLNEGLNVIRVIAIDFAGNRSPVRTMQIDYRILDPTNDVFVSAIELPGASGTTTAITKRATLEVGEPMHAGNEGGHSLWWWWQAPADGVLQLDTSPSTFDTLLGLYTGTNVAKLTEIASNDDANNSVTSSAISQAVKSGQVYRIAVDGYGGSSGTNTLNYQFAPSSVNLITVDTAGSGTVNPGTGYYASGAAVSFTATADAGWEFTGWTGAVVSSANPVTLTPAVDSAITANFQRRQMTDDFELGTFNPANDYVFNSPGSSAPWVVQTNDVFQGQYAARSGVVGQSQQSILTLRASSAGGVGTFMYRVSSEAGWDFLEFYVNGVLEGEWSGVVSWVEHQFNVPAGNNVFEWRYAKDFNIGTEDDAAFLDNLALPTSAQSLTFVANSVKGGKLELRGQPNAVYRIEASSDLTHWEPISTNSTPSGVIQILDPQAQSMSARFYRAILE